MNEIFTEMHRVTTDEEYMIWYMSITRYVIASNLEQVSPLRYMQCK
jgi:hypothetical protein